MTDDIHDAPAPLESSAEQVMKAAEEAAPASMAAEEAAAAPEPATAPETPAVSEVAGIPELAAAPEAAASPEPGEAAAPADELSGSLSAEDFAAAVARTVVEFREGSLVSGTVVRVDPDEVAHLVKQAMEDVVELQVPLRVDLGTGPTLAEAKG